MFNILKTSILNELQYYRIFYKYPKNFCAKTLGIKDICEEDSEIDKFSNKDAIVPHGHEAEIISTNENFNVDKYLESISQNKLQDFRPNYIFHKFNDLTSKAKKENNFQISENAKFKQLLLAITKSAQEANATDIVDALRSLKDIGEEKNTKAKLSLEKELSWKIDRCSVSDLLTIYDYYSDIGDEDVKKKVLLQVMTKWTTIDRYSDFLKLYSLSHELDAGLIANLDEKMMEVSEDMSLLKVSKIFCSLVLHKRRKPILTALAYQMFKKDEQLPAKQIYNQLFAMKRLSFLEPNLIQKICSDFIAQIENAESQPLIKKVVNSVGLFKYRDEKFIDKITNWMIQHPEYFNASCWKTMFLTMAHVNYVPSGFHPQIENIISKISYSDINDPIAWVDYVWAMLCIKKVKKEHVNSILDPLFANGIAADDPALVGTHLKILNINAYARYMLDGYNGPFLQSNKMENLLITQSHSERSLNKYVIDIVENICPAPKYLKSNIYSNLGVFVDAQFILDKNKKPIELKQYDDEFKKSDCKVLPDGAHRFAILIQSYKSFTIGTQNLTGQSQLNTEILHALGYKVIEIPFYDIRESKKIVTRVQYIERKIENALRS